MSRAQLKSLYTRLGGESRLTSILQDFYQRMSQDVLIGFFFVDRDLTSIIQKQKEFMLAAMGLKTKYTGRSPQQAHSALPSILSGHFDRRLTLLKSTLNQQGLSDEDIRIWIRFENSFRKVIVAKTETIP